MDRAYLDLTLPNFITVTLIAAVGIAVMHMVVAFAKNNAGIPA